MRRWLLYLIAAVASAQCPTVTAISAAYSNGQVFVKWTDPASACGTGTCRFQVYRSTSGAISSWASATKVAERIPNNSALRPDFPGAYTGMTAAYRANAASPMSIVPPATTASATGSGAWAYKPTGTATSYWGVSTVATDASCSESSVVSPDNVTTSSVSEAVAAITPIQQAASTDSGRNPSLYSISGTTGLPLLVDLHASDGQLYDPVAHGPTVLKGDVWNFWGDSTMGWEQGIPQAFVVAENKTGAHELTYGPFSTFPSTPYSLLLMPQDHQWAKDGTKGTQMDWMGALSRPLGVADTTGFASAPTAYFSNFIENQLDFVLPWVINRYNADPNRIYATGHSMGAWGTVTYASYRPSIFAAVFGDRPAFKMPRMPINVMLTAGNTSAYSTTYKMDDTTTLFNTKALHINRLDCAAPRPPILWGIGSADGWTVWADHQTFYTSAAACHNFVAMAFSGEGHGTKNVIAMYAGYADAFRKNVSYPAPTNWSQDDPFDMSSSPRWCTAQSATACWCRNCGWSWSSPDGATAYTPTDTSTTWSAKLTNSIGAGTADVSPRNTQSFRPAAGAAVHWSTNNAQSGTATVDAYGVVTATGVNIAAGGTVISFELGGGGGGERSLITGRVESSGKVGN